MLKKLPANFINLNKRGTTLIEIIIYLAILAFLGGVVVSFIFQTLGINQNLSRTRTGLDNAQSAMAAITQEVRFAKEIYKPTSCFDSICPNTGQLSLVTTRNVPSDETTGFVDFYLDNYGLYAKRDGQSPQLLTSDGVKVTKFSIADLQGGGGEGGSEILSPNGPGDTTNIPGQFSNSGSHWDKLDETPPLLDYCEDLNNDNVPDSGFFGCVYNNSSNASSVDTYALQDTALTTQTISSVDVVAAGVDRNCAAGGNAGVEQFGLKLGSNFSLGGLLSHFADCISVYTESNLPRPGGGCWQVSDLNNLMVYADVRSGDAGELNILNRISVKVNYGSATCGSSAARAQGVVRITITAEDKQDSGPAGPKNASTLTSTATLRSY